MGQEQSVPSMSEAGGSEVRNDDDKSMPMESRKPSFADTEDSSHATTTKDGLQSYSFLVSRSPSPEDKGTPLSAGQIVVPNEQEPFAEVLEEHVMAVDFGDDEEQQTDGRYVNQFGEMTRSTSYKLFRGGNGSVNSFTSLAQFAASERGSVSVPVADLDDEIAPEANTDDASKATKTEELTKTEVVNQFGCVQRVESCVLFGVEDEVVEEAAATVVKEDAILPVDILFQPAEENEGIINQFGTVARVESCVLFGVNDEVEEAANNADEAAATKQNNAVDEMTSQPPANKEEVLNQFGAIPSRPSCVLFGVEDDAKKAARQVAVDKVINDPFADALEEPQGNQVVVNFGDEERQDDDPKAKGRYVNQFGEIVRSTSYKMLRGGTGSVNSLTSLNQFGSELGSSLGSVCELNALDDNKNNENNGTGSGSGSKHAPVVEVVNQVSVEYTKFLCWFVIALRCRRACTVSKT